MDIWLDIRVGIEESKGLITFSIERRVHSI